jgi:hypothetical protein
MGTCRPGWGSLRREMIMDSARLGPVSDCTANYRPARSSERAPYIKKKVNSRHQDELADKPSVAIPTSNFEQELVIGESSRQNSSRGSSRR